MFRLLLNSTTFPSLTTIIPPLLPRSICVKRLRWRHKTGGACSIKNWRCAATLTLHFLHVYRVPTSLKSPTGFGLKNWAMASSIELEYLMSNKISLNLEKVVETYLHCWHVISWRKSPLKIWPNGVSSLSPDSLMSQLSESARYL